MGYISNISKVFFLRYYFSEKLVLNQFLKSGTLYKKLYKMHFSSEFGPRFRGEICMVIETYFRTASFDAILPDYYGISRWPMIRPSVRDCKLAQSVS